MEVSRTAFVSIQPNGVWRRCFRPARIAMAIAGSSIAVMGLVFAGTAEGVAPAGRPASAQLCAACELHTPRAMHRREPQSWAPGTAACPNAILSGTQLTGANALDTVTIQNGAQLVISDGTTALDTAGIDVFGTLQIGTAACPVQGGNKVTINFLGVRTVRTTPPPTTRHVTRRGSTSRTAARS